MATATTTTTTVAAITMEAIAVRNLSKVEKSTHLTVKSASARIPSTKSRDVTIHARLDSTSAMATATTRTTTAAASTMEATVAVPTSKKLTARNASARIPSTRKRKKTRIAKINARLKITSAMVTATTSTTTATAGTMEAIAVLNLSQVELSRKITARNASARIPKTNKDMCT